MKSTVNLTYFKRSGKYYSHGKYETEKEYIWDIIDELKRMKNLPGLSCDWYCSSFFIYGNYDHPDCGCPFLIKPNEFNVYES